jgi:predicted transcriptional regulator
MDDNLSPEFLAKVKAVAQGPDADLFFNFLDLLYQRREEYDAEPLTPDDRAAIREGKEAIKRGEFVTLAEMEKELDL